MNKSKVIHCCNLLRHEAYKEGYGATSCGRGENYNMLTDNNPKQEKKDQKVIQKSSKLNEFVYDVE